MSHWRTWAKWAAVAIVAALIGLLAWERFLPVYPTKVLASFVRDARWSEGRSALDLPWRPYDGEEKVADYMPMLVALYKKAPTDERELKLAMAQLYLWRADTGDYERAEAHVNAFPEDAEALNEHALVLLARDKPIEALHTILGALDRAPGLPAALFNRAVLMERLLLEGEAKAAWGEFLAVEREGPWAKEARGRLAALQQDREKPETLEQQLAHFGKRLRELASREELDRLLAEPSTSPLLEELGEQGELLYQLEIDFLLQLDGEGWRRRGGLAARYARERDRVLAGRADFRRIEELGRSADDPLLTVNFHRLALYDATQRSDLEGARRIERAIQSLCMTHGCVEAAVLASSDIASLLHESGRTHEAEEALERADQQLLPSSTVRRAELLLKRASLAQKAGAIDRAMGRAAEAVQLARIHGDDLPLASALLNVGSYSVNRGMPGVGVAYAREARAVAVRAGLARVAHLATGNQAEALLALGRLEEAAGLLETAITAAKETAIPNVLRANRLLLARLRLRQGRNEEAIALAERFADGASQTALAKELPGALHLQANAHFAMGNAAAGVTALRKATQEARRYVGLADSPLAARALSAQFAPIVAAYAGWLASQGNAEAVWALVGAAELRALEADECFVAQVRLADGWGQWVADSTGSRFRRLASERSPLAPGGCPPTTRRITLIDGVTTDAAGLSRSLRLENPEVAVVLSARADAGWPDGGVSGAGLVVHSPQPVRLDLGLGFLPAAPREAAVLMRSLPGSTELRDGAATPAAVASMAGERSLLHFAVHGVSSTASNAASFLLLGGDSGHLEVVDILAMPLAEKRPVVVLTACKSGTSEGSVEHNGGGLTWAFRQAGARAVIAYQDNLDDAAALLFSEAFYSALADGAGLSSAFESGVARVREKRSAAAAAAFLLAI